MLCTEQKWWKARELKEYAGNGVWITPSHRYSLRVTSTRQDKLAIFFRYDSS
jgi:hypothetical protein